MAVLIEMSVRVDDPQRFVMAVGKNRVVMERAGARNVMIARSEADPYVMLMSAEWDSHKQMHDSSKRSGDLFNHDAGTEGKQWETRVWQLV